MEERKGTDLIVESEEDAGGPHPQAPIGGIPPSPTRRGEPAAGTATGAGGGGAC